MKYDDRISASTQLQKQRFKPVTTRTKAYAQSPIPQMIKVANSIQKADTQTRIILNSGQVIVIGKIVNCIGADYYS